MREDYALAYRRLYQEHWWWRAREALLVRELSRLRLPPSGGRLLDVGCGDGLFFERLAEFGAVEGVEPRGTGLADCARVAGEREAQVLRPGEGGGLVEIEVQPAGLLADLDEGVSDRCVLAFVRLE